MQIVNIHEARTHLSRRLEIVERGEEVVIARAWLPIYIAHILKLPDVSSFDDHRASFDRLLVAQSLAEPLILLTVDSRLTRYGSTVRVL